MSMLLRVRWRLVALFVLCCFGLACCNNKQVEPRRSVQTSVAEAEAAFAREDWSVAVAHFREAIEQGGDNDLLQMRLGFALHMQGEYSQAMPHHLRAAESTHPEIRIDGLYNAACASARLGENDRAIQFLVRAFDAGFRDAKQLEIDADMDSIRERDRFKQIVAAIAADPARKP